MKFILPFITFLCAVWVPFYLAHFLPDDWKNDNKYWWTAPMAFSLVLVSAGFTALTVYLGCKIYDDSQKG